MPSELADREKRSVALNSLGAALALTAMKLVVGIATNSLGILAEAAHSALDLVAAAVTYIAVSISGKPADSDHLFGHGKAENLSALIESLLLVATAVWILYEGFQRLAVHDAAVDPSIWAFLVMGISIVVDYTRSKMLYQAAEKHNSQALEADALHFSTDIWSSAVVILGLVGVLVARQNPSLQWLARADAGAAMIVALIVIFVSVQLGWRTVQALLDTAPKGMAEDVCREVEGAEGILDCHRVRIRPSGPEYFIDFHVTMDGSQTLEASHALVEQVEERVRALVPGSDVTVHVDPVSAVPWVRDRLDPDEGTGDTDPEEPPSSAT